MSHPNDERDERVEPPERVWITREDAYPWPTAEMGGDEYVCAEAVNKLMLAMHAACVAKVRETADRYELAAESVSDKRQFAANVLKDTALVLESLTLDRRQNQEGSSQATRDIKASTLAPEG